MTLQILLSPDDEGVAVRRCASFKRILPPGVVFTGRTTELDCLERSRIQRIVDYSFIHLTTPLNHTSFTAIPAMKRMNKMSAMTPSG
jgi:hypothetical protein